MTPASSEERFRAAAEAEGGEPVSAGARIFHVRTAMESGRVFYVDLSSLPEDARPPVIAEIRELVDRALARAKAVKTDPQKTSGAVSGPASV